MPTQPNWLWPISNVVSLHLRAALWPCGVFGRNARRLWAISLGEDAMTIPEPGFFSPDCVAFIALIPCQSCIVCFFRNQVRSLYGINGNFVEDLSAAMYCSTFTMVSVEQEILAREEQRKRLAGSHSKQYQHHDPMTYLSPESAMTKPSSKEKPSSLDATSAKNLGKHFLDDHKIIAAKSVRSPHSLESDSTIPPLATTPPFVKLNHDQNLARDVLASSGTGGTVGHGLPAHKPSQVRVTRPAHQLSDDATIVSGSKRDTGNVLDERAKGDTEHKLTEAMRMSDDHAGVAVATAGSEVGSSKLEEA
ncbi:hypothetical protein E4U21_000702 [Claviceps maximensis]|nr:hypothetical protein E4U21_000702 [Claviceps maximensis]